MKITSSLVTFSAVITMLLGCNANTSPKFTYTALEIVQSDCQRSQNSEKVTITNENLSKSVNDSNGCYGNNEKLCDVRIYEVMVESFNHSDKGPKGYQVAWGPSKHGGNLQGIIEKLDYIKSTGANAIWLTPIFASKKIEGQDWTYDNLDATGYFTSDYFAIDENFGTKEDLKELVNKAHKMGMYVILDAVFGHAKENVNTVSPKGNKLYLTPRCRTEFDTIDKVSLKLARCSDPSKSLEFYKDVVEYWIDEVKVDGFRLDQAYQLAPEYWSQIFDHVQMVSQRKSNAYRLAGKTVQPLGFMVSEVWSDNPRILEANTFKVGKNLTSFDFPLATNIRKVFGETYKECMIDASTLNQSLIKSRGYTKPGITTSFIGNHDLPRLGDVIERSRVEKEGSLTPNYYKAHEAAYSFLASISSPIQMYYGEEVGAEVLNFAEEPQKCVETYRCDDHVSRSDVDFVNLSNEQKQLKNNIAKFLNLRDQYKSLAHGIRRHVYSDDSIYIDLKQTTNESILYFLNVGEKARNVQFEGSAIKTLGFKNNCSLENLITHETFSFFNQLTIKPLSGSFYKVNCM